MFRRFALPGALALASMTAAVTPSLAQAAAAPAVGPSLWGMFEPTVITVASGLVGLAVTWAAARFHALTGIQIDQKYQDDLHRAADTGIHIALDNGGVVVGDALAGNAKLATVGAAMKWVNASVPEALKALDVTPDQVRGIVTSKLNKVLSAAPSATAVAVAPGSAEVGKGG